MFLDAMLKKTAWLMVVSLCLWICMLMPVAVLVAMLGDYSLSGSLGWSWVAMPLIFLLVVVVFKSRNARLRWWIFQYLGAGTVAVSAAILTMILSLMVESRTAGLIGLMLTVIFVALAVYKAHQLVVVPLRLTSSKLVKTIRLLHISDIHIGSRKPAFLAKVVEKTSQQNPDYVLITGDLVDEDINSTDLAPLRQIEVPVLYCSGNHERYVSYQKVLDQIQAQGVIVLSDQSTTISGLNFIGLQDTDDPLKAERRLLQVVADNEEDIDGHRKQTKKAFSILLNHQPNLWPQAQVNDIDLMLSGHTHKGQIWPFGLLVKLRYPYHAGHYQQAGRHLFVSQGTGTWGPVMRFGTQCEIAVIDLVAE